MVHRSNMKVIDDEADLPVGHEDNSNGSGSEEESDEEDRAPVRRSARLRGRSAENQADLSGCVSKLSVQNSKISKLVIYN